MYVYKRKAFIISSSYLVNYGLVRHFGKSTWEELSCPAQMPNLALSSAQAAMFAPKHRRPKNEKLTCS